MNAEHVVTLVGWISPDTGRRGLRGPVFPLPLAKPLLECLAKKYVLRILLRWMAHSLKSYVLGVVGIEHHLVMTTRVEALVHGLALRGAAGRDR